MKYLSDYTEQAQSNLFEELGAFFAFNTDQFHEGAAKVGGSRENKITSFMNGGYVLSKNLDLLIDGLNNIQELGIKQDIKENGIKNIIHREMGNYEVQLSGELERVYDALEDYPITKEEIKAEYKSYFQNCVNNDWF